MILYGASGHAKVIIDILEKSGETVDHLVDANPKIKKLAGYSVTWWDTFKQTGNQNAIISIGSNETRKKWSVDLDVEFGVAVHPQAVLANEIDIREGTVVMAGTVVNSGTSIGKHCIINTGASIDHDCVIEDYVHISPESVLCGGIVVGEGTQIGAGAVIVPNLTIGRWVTIGAGSIVTKNIPDFAVVVGNPGKIIKYNDREG